MQTPPATATAVNPVFQARVCEWLVACFGPDFRDDRPERMRRFLEECLELVQAGGFGRAEAHWLVDYVYDRTPGEIHQEIGGTMTTLAALCLTLGRDMHEDGERELARINLKVDAIRAKAAAKPRFVD